MDYFISFLQLTVALTILNVWCLRLHKETRYRGKNSKNLKQEIAVYGLPSWSFWTIGFIKIIASISLIMGLWFPVLIIPSTVVLICMMIGAIYMHIKVSDTWIKSMPATAVFLCAIVVLIYHCS